MSDAGPGPLTGWRGRLHEIIFEADTTAGKLFDLVLLLAILASVTTVMLYSVPSVRAVHGPLLRNLEWVFTILFTVEYLLRLMTVRKPLRYATSFFGVVDLLSVLPTYLDVLIPGSHHLLSIRILRVLRVFRVFKLVTFLREANSLAASLRRAQRKILIFLFFITVLTVILGSLMYLVEPPSSGFTSIPKSVYWAIVTLTTVGYGDITPQTPWGQALSAFVMILGYAIIAIPTGIVTAEMAMRPRDLESTQACQACGRDGHASDAKFCKFCGGNL